MVLFVHARRDILCTPRNLTPGPRRRHASDMMKLSFFLAATTLIAQDCPRFPLAERQEWQTARALDEAWQQRKAGSNAKAAIQLPRANFIDRILFQAMEHDAITAA